MEEKRQIAWELFNESLGEGKRFSLKSQGSCMEPLFSSDSVITFIKKDDFKFGDLVVYRDNSSLVAHRFMYKRIKAGQEQIILKADNSWQADKPVDKSCVLGAVIKIEKDGSVISLDTFGGNLKNIYSFFLAHINLILKLRLPAIKKRYTFDKELTVINLLIKDDLNAQQLIRLKEYLSTGLDWKYLREKIKWNFIAPLVAENLKTSNLQNCIPQEFIADISNLNLFELALDTRKRAVLEDVLAELQKQNIKTFITKGTQLGLEVYGQSFHRWMGDIDLIVEPGSWSAAGEILGQIGFKPCNEVCPPDTWALQHLDIHTDFYKDGVMIELKSNLWAISFPYFDFDYWQNARKVEIDGESAFFPSYEEMLLISTLSLARHNFSGLLWFLDVKNIIKKFSANIDWKKFMLLAKRYDLESIAYHSFRFTNVIFDEIIPQEVLAGLDPGFIKRVLFSLLWDREAILLKKEKSAFRAKLPFEFVLVIFSGKFSFRLQKARCYIRAVFGMFFPPRGYILSKYGSRAVMRYYLLRILKAISRIFSSVLGFIKIRAY